MFLQMGLDRGAKRFARRALPLVRLVLCQFLVGGSAATSRVSNHEAGITQLCRGVASILRDASLRDAPQQDESHCVVVLSGARLGHRRKRRHPDVNRCVERATLDGRMHFKPRNRIQLLRSQDAVAGATPVFQTEASCRNRNLGHHEKDRSCNLSRRARLGFRACRRSRPARLYQGADDGHAG